MGASTKSATDDLGTLTDKTRNGTHRRVEFPPDLVKEIDGLPPDQRRLRMMAYLEEHGEDVGPGEGYGPRLDELPKIPWWKLVTHYRNRRLRRRWERRT